MSAPIFRKTILELPGGGESLVLQPVTVLMTRPTPLVDHKKKKSREGQNFPELLQELKLGDNLLDVIHPSSAK